MPINLKPIRTLPLAGAAAFALTAFATLTPAMAGSYSFDIDDHEDLLERMIEMDADEIAEMRDGFEDASEEIADAINDIEEAQEEIKDAPFAGLFAKIALRTARAAVSNSADAAIADVREEAAKAEAELESRRDELGEAEYNETREAFAVLYDGLDIIEEALDELGAALKEV